MSEQQTETTEKRSPGRPKGAKTKRPVRREPVHRGPHGGDEEPDLNPRYEFYPHEARDRFHIPKDVTDSIEADWGQKLMWIALECLGKENEFVATRRRNQWEEVRKGDFEGQFDHFGIKDGIVRIENLALFRQPIEISRKAVDWERRQAAAAITNMRRSHAETGVDNIPMPGGASHPSARAQNRHKTSWEEGPKIPE
jgi:hypothetical protein